jgi:hypothetical protein
MVLLLNIPNASDGWGKRGLSIYQFIYISFLKTNTLYLNGIRSHDTYPVKFSHYFFYFLVRNYFCLYKSFYIFVHLFKNDHFHVKSMKEIPARQLTYVCMYLGTMYIIASLFYFFRREHKYIRTYRSLNFFSVWTIFWKKFPASTTCIQGDQMFFCEKKPKKKPHTHFVKSNA